MITLSLATTMGTLALDTIQTFLSRGSASVLSSTVLTKAYPKVSVVTGNSAADADSIVSSICLSYLKDCIQQGDDGREKDIIGETSGRQCQQHRYLHVPVMPIVRSDFALRHETALLFAKAGLESKELVFSDEIDFLELYKRGELKLTLVDHNSISHDNIDVSDAVVEIIDHHADAGLHPKVVDGLRDIAFSGSDQGSLGTALVGSACTLVAERFLSLAPHALSHTVAVLLLGVICADTVNLDPQAKRATERDVAAVAALEKICSDVDRNALYQELSDAKFDPAFWNSLTVSDCLRFDYKKFDYTASGGATQQYVGISAVLMLAEDFLAKDGVLEGMKSFAEAQNVELLVVMTNTRGPPRRRQLILFAPRSKDLSKSLLDSLSEKAPDLDLAVIDAGDGPIGKIVREGNILVIEQGNLAASRKQVAPGLIDCLSKL